MSTEVSPSQGQKQRQTLTAITGWVGVALGVLLCAATARSATAGMIPFIGAAVACGAYCVLARPFITADSDGVTISNVLREVTLPWGGISHAASRGSLVVHDTEGHRTTVWAIGSRKARSPKMMMGDTGAPADDGSTAALLLPSDSPQALREAINTEVIDNPDGPSGRVVRWLPVPCLLMSIAVVALVIGLLR